MFIPPFADPLDPDVHPLIWREVNLVGANMAFRLEQAGQERLDLRLFVRRVLDRRHAQHRLVEEHHRPAARDRVGAHRLAGVHRAERAARRHARDWSITRPPSIIRIRGRAGGGGCATSWTTSASPRTRCSSWPRDYREDLLRNVATRAAAAVAHGASRARRIASRREQRDWPTAQHLAWLMAEHNVEVRQAANGDYWIPLAQPYSKFVTEMMEPQRYPEVRLQPGRDVLRPYDVATLDAAAADGRAAWSARRCRRARRASPTSSRPRRKSSPAAQKLARKPQRGDVQAVAAVDG